MNEIIKDLMDKLNAEEVKLLTAAIDDIQYNAYNEGYIEGYDTAEKDLGVANG